MNVGVILGKRPEDCNDCKIAIHNEEEFRCPLCPYYNFAGFDSMVPPDECPLQEVEPVQHGRWRETCGWDDDHDTALTIYECSECKHQVHFGEYSLIRPKYCPYCGAKMDGGAE